MTIIMLIATISNVIECANNGKHKREMKSSIPLANVSRLDKYGVQT